MKKETFSIVFILFIVLFSINCHARDENGLVTRHGIGNNSCGKMTEDIKTYAGGQATYTAYIDGYLSGYNIGRLGKDDYVYRTDSISRYKFVLRYCENNPLDDVVYAINQLILKTNKSLW